MKQAEDELTAAAERIAAEIAKKTRLGLRYIVIDTDQAELIRQLLEGMAAHWKDRPIGDLDIYLATPLCKLARHITGRTT